MLDERKRGKDSVTLEQLLQLKRSERPDRGFWEEFDREFQRRRLASLVTAEPWYFGAWRVVMVVLRRSAPVGAAAAALAAGYLVFDSRRAEQVAVTPVKFAEVNAETMATVLPEEHLGFSHSVAAEPSFAEFSAPSARPRYVVNEIGGVASRPTGQFVTVTTPHTLSIADDDSGAYRVHTLSTTPSFGSPATPASQSF